MLKKSISTNQKSNKNNLLLLSGVCLITVLLVLWGGYHLGYTKSANAVPKVNTPGYVIGQQATERVANFFTQYTNPKTLSIDKI